MTKVTIEKIKRNILINESIKHGWEICGLKVVGVMENHWHQLPEKFIDDIYRIFNGTIDKNEN